MAVLLFCIIIIVVSTDIHCRNTKASRVNISSNLKFSLNAFNATKLGFIHPEFDSERNKSLYFVCCQHAELHTLILQGTYCKVAFYTKLLFSHSI